MKTYQKVLLAIAVLVILLLAGVQLYFSFFLDQRLKSMAVEEFEQRTDQQYNLQLDDLSLSVFGRSLSLEGITVSDSESSERFGLSVDGITFSGIQLWNLVRNRTAHIGQIEINNPDLKLRTSSGNEEDNEVSGDLTTLSPRLAESVLSVFENADIDELSINSATASLSRDESNTPFLTSGPSDFIFYNLRFDKEVAENPSVIPTDEVEMTLREVEFNTENQLYSIGLNRLEFSTLTGAANLDSFAVEPRLDREELVRRVEHEIDLITLHIPELNLKDIDFGALNRMQGYRAGEVSISNPDLDVYRDKRPPSEPNKTPPPLPQEILRSINPVVNIDSLGITGGTIRYTERLPEAPDAGYIDFEEVEASLTNITNDSARIEEGISPQLFATASVMGDGELEANFTFPMDGTSVSQSIRGKLGAMDARSLNNTLEHLAFVRIDEGTINEMEFNIELEDDSSSGEVVLLYEGLKISILDPETGGENLGNQVKSLLANTFGVRSDNGAEDPRTGEVSFERDKEKSTFNYWWKSLLSGIESTIRT